MDSMDKRILAELQVNAKQNTKEIAGKIGLSVTPTYERIKKLEQRQVIRSYVALLDRDKIGKQVVAYCQVTLLQHQKDLIAHFKEKILLLAEIMECHHVSGNYDFLLKVVTNNIPEFHEFINQKLSVVDGISTIHSSFVMHSLKDTTAFNL
ncbi:Lrp/AsnC family transcriptional regulator [Flavilitoribacter nigricans]|uniref:AsnC family transcriptional regulator n=1 Tax=Flavilitoribacter nigricans (strain ATCC 23147 / DSM 23189 / NBRC 102662 / NCIMB 1420 / SS-2) TaxID=1122177 RepID=A0A2D0N443_FLAN2|nr:Lrp/AsnC family transcriptional regulator [Flavilitoribacter nigricans]PHN02533.1 AsnC family transcriptional regulator [Flavilitoribacter nigricans DSM 23189 = NBRC 102662]